MNLIKKIKATIQKKKSKKIEKSGEPQRSVENQRFQRGEPSLRVKTQGRTSRDNTHHSLASSRRGWMGKKSGRTSFSMGEPQTRVQRDKLIDALKQKKLEMEKFSLLWPIKKRKLKKEVGPFWLNDSLFP